MKEMDIRRYRILVRFLGKALGSDYEIVLTDLHSVLAIEHGEISGRKEGAPLSDIAMRSILSKEYMYSDWKLNYQGHTEKGKVLRCSMLFIKTQEDRLAGMLSINFDDSRYKELADRVFQLCHPDGYVEEMISIRMNHSENPEILYQDIAALIERIGKETLGLSDLEDHRLRYDEKLSIIRELERNGAFAIKGAIPLTAGKLSCSPASMYRYIGIVRKDIERKTGERGERGE